jgi:hypothetical protein
VLIFKKWFFPLLWYPYYAAISSLNVHLRKFEISKHTDVIRFFWGGNDVCRWFVSDALALACVMFVAVCANTQEIVRHHVNEFCPRRQKDSSVHIALVC